MLSIQKLPNLPASVTIDPSTTSVKNLEKQLLGLDIEQYQDSPNQGITVRIGSVEANIKRADLINVVLGLQMAEEINRVDTPEEKNTAAPNNHSKSQKNP